ncbi:hypothetical protein [Solemya velesiana gill symbiont]|uniref:hypothetical protein n=1 Tax=Solemya velesiana gill symbiont TaxID=1918948 RepID=UPI001C12AFCD|nr:hypothetical protein [Solemya velesiana gill symbiont]
MNLSVSFDRCYRLYVDFRILFQLLRHWEDVYEPAPIRNQDMPVIEKRDAMRVIKAA